MFNKISDPIKYCMYKLSLYTCYINNICRGKLSVAKPEKTNNNIN